MAQTINPAPVESLIGILPLIKIITLKKNMLMTMKKKNMIVMKKNVMTMMATITMMTMTFISYDLNWFQLLEQSLSLSTCCDGSGAPKPSSVWSPDPMMFLTFPDPSSGAQPPMSRDTRSATKFEKHCNLVKLFKNKRFRSSCTFKTAVHQTGHLKKYEVKKSPKPFWRPNFWVSFSHDSMSWMVQGYRPWDWCFTRLVKETSVGLVPTAWFLHNAKETTNFTVISNGFPTYYIWKMNSLYNQSMCMWVCE